MSLLCDNNGYTNKGKILIYTENNRLYGGWCFSEQVVSKYEIKSDILLAHFTFLLYQD